MSYGYDPQMLAGYGSPPSAQAGYAYPTFPGASFAPYAPYPVAYPYPDMPPVARGLNLNLPVIPKTLFVGNLANSVTSELLENAFSQFGTVTQVKYMRTNHYAFITFASPKEATWAKANMNGITLEGRILRVSWGKAEGQTKTYEEADEDDFFRHSNLEPVAVLVPQGYKPASDSIPEGSDQEGDWTLFVGNLAGQTTPQVLQAFFKQFGRARPVRLNQDKHYAFISFVAKEDAETAKSLADSFNLDGRSLRVNWGKQQQQPSQPQINSQQPLYPQQAPELKEEPQQQQQQEVPEPKEEPQQQEVPVLPTEEGDTIQEMKDEQP